MCIIKCMFFLRDLQPSLKSCFRVRMNYKNNKYFGHADHVYNKKNVTATANAISPLFKKRRGGPIMSLANVGVNQRVLRLQSDRRHVFGACVLTQLMNCQFKKLSEHFQNMTFKSSQLGRHRGYGTHPGCILYKETISEFMGPFSIEIGLS